MIITAGAQEIKYEKAAGELPVKGEMKKQQVLTELRELCSEMVIVPVMWIL